MVAPSKRNCRIAQRIARVPRRALGAHTRSSCSRNVTVWQAVSRHIQRRLNHRNLAGTPAQGASIASTTTRPWPCAIQPTTRAPRQLVARLNIKHQIIWGASHAHQMEALQTDEQITPIKRHTAAGRVGHRPRSLKTAGVEVRSSARTSTSTRNPPTNTYSPTLNSEEPLNSCRNHLIPTKIAHRRFISFFTPSECDTASQTLTKEYASGLRGTVNKTAGAYVPRPQVPTHPIERDSPCAPTRLACVS